MALIGGRENQPVGAEMPPVQLDVAPCRPLGTATAEGLKALALLAAVARLRAQVAAGWPARHRHSQHRHLKTRFQRRLDNPAEWPRCPIVS